MNKGYLFIPLFFFIFILGCSIPSKSPLTDSWIIPNGKLKVLSTIAMIDDLVKEIGGEHVDTMTLIKKGLNPHNYQLVKGDNEKFLFADLIFYNGLGLEHGPSCIAFFKANSKCIGLGEQILRNHPDLLIELDGEADPHIWMDASIWSQAIPIITANLSEKDPANATYFQKNAEILQNKVGQLHQQLKSIIHSIPEKKRYLITSHDAFNYFARAYLAENVESKNQDWHKRFASPEGLSPESQLGINHIQDILDYMIKHHVHVLFTESNINRDSIRKIATAAKKKGIEMIIPSESLYSDDMGETGSAADSYIKMMQYNAQTIAHYLNLNPN